MTKRSKTLFILKKYAVCEIPTCSNPSIVRRRVADGLKLNTITNSQEIPGLPSSTTVFTLYVPALRGVHLELINCGYISHWRALQITSMDSHFRGCTVQPAKLVPILPLAVIALVPQASQKCLVTWSCTNLCSFLQQRRRWRGRGGCLDAVQGRDSPNLVSKHPI